MRRIQKWLGYWNNVLLIPLFTMMVLESSVRGSETYDFKTANLVFCAFFILEWCVGLYLAEEKRKYLKSVEHGIDLISSIPFGYLFQSFRVFRLVRIARVVRLIVRARRFRGEGTRAIKVLLIVGAIVFAGGLALRIVEPETVPIFTDALWWSFVTLSTVGYGDIIPTTDLGKLVASVLMFFGVGVFGYIAGFMSNLIDDEEDEILVTVTEINERLKRLEQTLITAPDRSEI